MTVRENLLPSAMVPGLVTVEDKDGNRQNLYPVDAREAIATGDFTLVENGAVEVARLAATPLRSGMATNIPSDQVVAEISGIEGRLVAADDPKSAEKLIKSGDNPDAVRGGAATTGAPAAKSETKSESPPSKSESKSETKSAGGSGSGAGGGQSGAAEKN
jgi:hypothetical protein